jgi:hypothetical protein
MAASENVATYDWHPFQKKTLLAMSLIGFICAGACAFFGTHTNETSGRIVSVCLGILFTMAGIALLIPTRTRINLSTHTLCRETLVFGNYPIRRKNLQFGEFSTVVIDKRSGDNSYDYFVGLKYLSGRKLWVTYFSNIPAGSPCSQAERVAEQFSTALQLPIKRTA